MSVGRAPPPQVLTGRLVEFADFTAADSPFSASCPAIMKLEPEERFSRTAVVYATADLARLEGISPRPHDGFNVGYVGTASFVKMHSDFVSMSASAEIKDARFIICGFHSSELADEIVACPSPQKFELKGFVKDIRPVLEVLDVFGYPLGEDNYSGAEMVLQEAMFAGIPPVVFPHGGAGRLVVDNYTGLVVDSGWEYARALEYLYHHPEQRERLGKNAREYALQMFSAKKAADRLNSIYTHLMTLPKRTRKWNSMPPIERKKDQKPPAGGIPWPMEPPEESFAGAHHFIESLGEFGGLFVESMTTEDHKALFATDEKIRNLSTVMKATDTGGVTQYLMCYPRDAWLLFWGGLVYDGMGWHESAYNSYTAAVANGFPHWRVYYHLASASEKLGRKPKAIEALRTLRQLEPEFTGAQEMLRRLGGMDHRILSGSICPHCKSKTSVSHPGLWICPYCNNEFVC